MPVQRIRALQLRGLHARASQQNEGLTNAMVLHQQEVMRISHDLNDVYQHIPDPSDQSGVAVGLTLPPFQPSLEE